MFLVRRSSATLWLLLFLVAWDCEAATYYVATNGNNATGDGSAVNPWLTVQKGVDMMSAGDLLLVGQGDYNEYVLTHDHGSSGARITVKTNGVCSIRGFRSQHRYNTLDGFSVKWSLDTAPWGTENSAHVRLEVAATENLITNCFIRDTPWIRSTNVNFIYESNAVIFPSGYDISGSNFIAGGHVYLGSDSSRPFPNHNTAWMIKAIDGTTAYLTNGSAGTMTNGTGSNFFCIMNAGSGSSGFMGVLSVSSGATNCTIANCTFSNLFGAAVQLYGNGHRVTSNKFTRLNSYYGARPIGSDQVYMGNVWKDSPNVIWFDQVDYATIPHPEGSSFWDYNGAFIHSQASGMNNSNNLFVWNWFENVEQQLAYITRLNGPNYGFAFRSNVFIGFPMHASGSMDGIVFDHNTFYRCAYEGTYALALGGTDGTDLQSNCMVLSNVFIDCGQKFNRSVEGWFSADWVTNFTSQGNFACGAEVTGWESKSSGTNLTYNGGDPLLVNPLNPIGPDGLAFTDDDGLRPQPNSPLAVYGLGALTPKSGVPLPHFTAVTANWTDWYYTNFQPGWRTPDPPMRGGPVRPYTTPDPISNAPTRVLFSATNSVDGLPASTTNTGISSYGWDFGDGSRIITAYPSATHTFMLTGQTLVTLSITNTSGGTAAFSNLYRVLPPTNYAGGRLYYVAKTGDDTNGGTNQTVPFLTIGKALTVVSSNDFVAVLPGIYHEYLDVTPATAGRITWLGYGATNKGWEFRKANHTLDGFCLNMTNPTLNYTVYVDPANTGGVQILNCTFSPLSWSKVTVVAYPTNGDQLGFIVPSLNLTWTNIGGGNNVETNGTLPGCATNLYTWFTTNSFGSPQFNVTWESPTSMTFRASVNNQKLIVEQRDAWRSAHPNVWESVSQQQYGGVTFATGDENWTNQPSSCLISNNLFQNMQGVICTVFGSSNVFAKNTFEGGNFQCDVFRIWGRDHVVTGNYVTNLGQYNENHIDFFQIFGPSYRLCSNILFEKNIIVNSPMQPVMMEWDPASSDFNSTFTNFTFRNNVFANVGYAANVDMSGTRWYNNLFYRVNYVNKGHVFSMGGTKGAAYNTLISNCVFYLCGNSNSTGWYPDVGEQGITNFDIQSDYNFIAGLTNSAMGADWGDDGNETHSINGGNPLFVSVSGLDFRILTNSPLIDKGIPIASFTDDILGVTRTGSWDIGPYEGGAAPATNTPRIRYVTRLNVGSISQP